MDSECSWGGGEAGARVHLFLSPIFSEVEDLATRPDLLLNNDGKRGNVNIVEE